ncbi:MAG: hypothetical protein K8R46_03660 [Pirellulales bacterium]|nr:hypothetical protein [Pirellulales bacterium]
MRPIDRKFSIRTSETLVQVNVIQPCQEPVKPPNLGHLAGGLTSQNATDRFVYLVQVVSPVLDGHFCVRSAFSHPLKLKMRECLVDRRRLQSPIVA